MYSLAREMTEDLIQVTKLNTNAWWHA
jgi:hypothetical protein